MTLFKPRVGKVIFAQTTGGLSVIIPKIYDCLLRVRFFFFLIETISLFLDIFFLGNQPILLNKPSLENFNFNKEEDRIFKKKKKICSLH